MTLVVYPSLTDNSFFTFVDRYCFATIKFIKLSKINGKRIVLDAVKLGFSVTVFLGVKLAAKGRVSLEDFERAVSAVPEVQLVQHVLGMYDYRLKVVATDLSDFERVLRRRIMTLPGVGDVEGNVLLSEEKRNFVI